MLDMSSLTVAKFTLQVYHTLHHNLAKSGIILSISVAEYKETEMKVQRQQEAWTRLGVRHEESDNSLETISMYIKNGGFVNSETVTWADVALMAEVSSLLEQAEQMILEAKS